MKTHIKHEIHRHKWLPFIVYEKKTTKVRNSNGQLLTKNKNTVEFK